ncbi:MAG: AMP-binding protein [Actinobacteria bacterium]|nr:AMP-binding protein [Actinomycetota bacterium]
MSDDHGPAGGFAPLVDGRAQEYGERVFLTEAATGRALTFAHLEELIRRRAAELASARVAAGARVLIDVADPIDFCTEYLGVVAAGRCAVPVNPAAPDAELARTVAAVGPAVLISDRPGRAEALGLSALETPPRPLPPSRGGITTLFRFGTPDKLGLLDQPAGSVLLLTSGSTGAPKAVELTDRQLMYVATGVAHHNQLGPDDRGYCPLPLFHINAQVVALLASLVAGATLVVDRKFRRTGFWERLADHDVTWINAVPAILTILAEYPVPVRQHPSRPARPKRLRFIRSASAPLPAAIRERVEDRAGVPVVESYGMTEAASQITAMPLDGSGPAGSCGRPVGVELQVRDTGGQPVAAGTTGIVWLRGPGVIRHYVNGRAPERFDADGWLNSGDLGYLDEDGFLFLAGRSDDVINRGGEMLYPREIEEVLMGDPAVQDAVVVGRPSPVLGQVPIAYVIPAGEPDSADHLQDLLRQLNGRCTAELSRFKRPEAIYVVQDLPRAATGKIQRHRLREAEAEANARAA